jgi:hypothetical protein
MELPASSRSGVRARRGEDPLLEKGAVAKVKKNAEKQERTIVFIDESGRSERPHISRTWSPRGQTPIVQYHFNWKTLSVIAGVTWHNFYFQLVPGAIRSPQVIIFLKCLMTHIKFKMLCVANTSAHFPRTFLIPHRLYGYQPFPAHKAISLDR